MDPDVPAPTNLPKWAAPLPRHRLLDRRAVELHFGISKRFLEVAATRGDGPAMTRIGRSVRYRVGDVEDWIDSKRVASTADNAFDRPRDQRERDR